jgi:Zn-dependent protease with chaperone function
VTLSYSVRLLCICFAAFFLIHALLVLSVEIAARRAIGFARGMSPRLASRFLFAVRMLPLALAGFVVLGLCLPSYLLLEPQAVGEEVGWPCMVIALLGAAICVASIVRMAKAAWHSAQMGRDWRSGGIETAIGAEHLVATVVQRQTPILAVAGIIQPRLIVSSSVLQSLSGEELNAALRHERAHKIWRDNFKRLLFVAAPRPFGLSLGLRALESQWSKFAEWAADDHAAASDSHRALLLATALIRFAKLGLPVQQTAIVSSFVDGSDLAERVERLLSETPWSRKRVDGRAGRLRHLLASAAVLAMCSLIAVAFWPASLFAVHQLLERLIG